MYKYFTMKLHYKFGAVIGIAQRCVTLYDSWNEVTLVIYVCSIYILNAVPSKNTPSFTQWSEFENFPYSGVF